MISTTLITCNRLQYTKKTINSYLKNTVIPHELIIVDNASDDGTQEYLKEMMEKKVFANLILNTKNKYPGYATNQGWQLASKEIQFLHRSDNDLVYKSGWDEEAIQAFKDFPKMGQLGLINELYQVPPSEYKDWIKPIKRGKTCLSRPMNPMGNVGGSCLIPKKLFDQGIRWEDDRWETTQNEDIAFSKIIKEAGYEIYELISEKVIHIGYGDINKYFNYYFKTYWKRQQLDWFYKRLAMENSGKIKNGKTTD